MKIKEIRKLFLIYFIAHGLSLGFFDAQFYDDINLFNWNKDFYNLAFKQINHIVPFSRVFIFLRDSAHVIPIFSFFLFFFSALIFMKTVKKFYSIKKETAYLITIFYLILPFGLIKFSFSILFYLLCMFFFILGWYFILRFRLLSLILFFLSFQMQSLLVLYSLPILSFYFYQKKKNFFCVKDFSFFLLKNFDFSILPFLFFFIKFFFYKGSGYYEFYNEIYDIRYLIINPILQFLDLFRNNLSIGFLILGSLAAFLIIKYVYVPLNNYKKENLSNFNIFFIIIGIIGSLFPYWIVGHIPTFTSYSSRHQLLLLISVPFLIIYLLNFLNKNYLKISIILIISLCLSINFKIYSDYYIESLKQKKLIQYISKNKIFFSNMNIVVINDKVKNSTVAYANDNNHIYNNGIFKRVFNNEKKFVININEINDYISGKFDNRFNDFYMASQHKRQNNINNIVMLTIETEGFLKFSFAHKKFFIN